MLVNEFQKAMTYIRETQEVALFATMADARWYAAFGASPLFFIILPFIGILLTVNALFNGYKFAKADNKNLDQWFNLATSAICAVLASISLYGAAISAFLGVSFTVGAWFFFSSLACAFTNQVVMMGINFYRAYESLSGSSQRMHSAQAALNNIFVLGLLSTAIGSVFFVMLFPMVAPVFGITCAMTAATLTTFDIVWRMIPLKGKLWIKEKLHLGKPELPLNMVELQSVPSLNSVVDEVQEVNPNHHRLFSCFEYSNEVKCMDVDRARGYLIRMIQRKIDSYGSEAIRPYDTKTQDKITVLTTLLDVVFQKEVSPLSKGKMIAKSPLAFQSFWVEKGDVEQLCDAVILFQKKDVDAVKVQTQGPVHSML